jgi:hypothetical protein
MGDCMKPHFQSTSRFFSDDSTSKLCLILQAGSLSAVEKGPYLRFEERCISLGVVSRCLPSIPMQHISETVLYCVEYTQYEIESTRASALIKG